MVKECRSCKKSGLTKDEVGINKKMFGDKIKEYYCLNCLAEYLEIDVEFLLEKIEEYKEQGCGMF